tara:strand:+ start:721 stop:1047 length:327 start_codon:yes stop_codon:yes gene_type:complete
MQNEMNEIIKDNWKVNYYLRIQERAKDSLNLLQAEGHEVQSENEDTRKYSLKEFIVFVGNSAAANIFECSPGTAKAYRYGRRQPSIRQAKIIIKNTGGKLDYESIYGL